MNKEPIEEIKSAVNSLEKDFVLIDRLWVDGKSCETDPGVFRNGKVILISDGKRVVGKTIEAWLELADENEGLKINAEKIKTLAEAAKQQIDKAKS